MPGDIGSSPNAGSISNYCLTQEIFHSNPSELLSFNKSEKVLWTLAKYYYYYIVNSQYFLGKWRYLVQNGEGNIQEVEWVTCDNTGESHCRTGEFDSPFGKKWTRCKQIFSIRKLLAIDEDGVISVDSFELPSACLCEYSEVSGLCDRRVASNICFSCAL